MSVIAIIILIVAIPAAVSPWLFKSWATKVFTSFSLIAFVGFLFVLPTYLPVAEPAAGELPKSSAITGTLTHFVVAIFTSVLGLLSLVVSLVVKPNIPSHHNSSVT